MTMTHHMHYTTPLMSTTHHSKGNANKIAVGNMNKILHVDYTAKTIRCEPGVTMGQITHELVPKGFALMIQVWRCIIMLCALSLSLSSQRP
jgi:hypothetical protein